MIECNEDGIGELFGFIAVFLDTHIPCGDEPIPGSGSLVVYLANQTIIMFNAYKDDSVSTFSNEFIHL